MRARIIVNPAAGRGTAGRRWPYVEEVLHAEGLAFDCVQTEHRGHATVLARAAAETGCDLIVAVGGDGTLNEIVNGMLEDGKAINPASAIGVISAGTGADFVRTAGLSREMDEAARHLARAAELRPLDIGEIAFERDGKQVRHYFANVAGMGFDGEVVERTERSGKRRGGTIPYLTALVTTLFKYCSKDVALQLDDHFEQGVMGSVMVCNGSFFGGGMRVGPDARLDDGKFQVVVLGDFGRLELLTNVWRVYKGTHLSHPKVRSFDAETVAVDPKQRMLIQADGELIGEGPATFRVLPAALKLRI